MDLDGRSAHLDFTVTESDTAPVLGSGDVPVLATPRLLAWCEAATCAAVSGALDAASTSVGIHVGLDHLAASPVGARVRVQADVVDVEGRQVRFSVAARHDDGRLVCSGEIVRAVVNVARFLARVAG